MWPFSFIYLLHLCNHSNLNFQRKSCGSPCEDVMHKSRQLKSLQHIQKEYYVLWSILVPKVVSANHLCRWLSLFFILVWAHLLKYKKKTTKQFLKKKVILKNNKQQKSSGLGSKLHICDIQGTKSVIKLK